MLTCFYLSPSLPIVHDSGLDAEPGLTSQPDLFEPNTLNANNCQIPHAQRPDPHVYAFVVNPTYPRTYTKKSKTVLNAGDIATNADLNHTHLDADVFVKPNDDDDANNDDVKPDTNANTEPEIKLETDSGTDADSETEINAIHDADVDKSSTNDETTTTTTAITIANTDTIGDTTLK